MYSFVLRTFAANFVFKNGAESQTNISGPLAVASDQEKQLLFHCWSVLFLYLECLRWDNGNYASIKIIPTKDGS